MQITITKDTISPELQRALEQLRVPPETVMRSLGNLVAKFAQDAFRNPSKRPAAWRELSPRTKRRKGHGKPLIDTGTLKRSPRVESVHGNEVVVVADRKAGAYSLAAIHHYGAPRAGIPARPFFPFFADGTPTPEIVKKAEGVVRAWLRNMGFK